MMKNATSAIVAAAFGFVCSLAEPVAAQQQGMQSSMPIPGFNVPLDPVRVSILNSYGYYEVTPNGNLVLYLVTGVPSATAMQGILAMFGQGNQYDNRAFYEVTTDGELVLYPPASQSGAGGVAGPLLRPDAPSGELGLQRMVMMPGVILMPSAPGLLGMPSMSAMWGMYGMPGLSGMYGMPGGWAARGQLSPR